MPRTPCRRSLAVPFFEPVEPRLLLTADLRITEFLAGNSRGLQDHEGDFSDWIEVYNNGPATERLEGWHLTDSAANLTQWQFPAVDLAPGAYLVVFASGKDRSFTWTDGDGFHTEYHTNFKLDRGGEFLALVAPDGATIASQYSPEYPEQAPDVSYGLSAEPAGASVVAAGAAAKWLVPAAASALDPAWTDVAFGEAGWQTGATGIGYDAYAAPASPGAGTFYWGPFGPGGAWHLYEVVTAAATWIAAYNAAGSKVQSGTTGHLVTITSAAEHQFVRSLIAQDSWIGLTDSDKFSAIGAQEYGDTSTGPAPAEGSVPGWNQAQGKNERGRGFVWVTAEAFTYHLNVWYSADPNNSGTSGQDAVYIRASDGLWRDDKSGEGSQTGVNKAYVIEYDLNLPSLGPAFTILEKQDPSIAALDAAVASLDAGGGAYWTSPFINFIDPQAYGKGHFGGCIPLPGENPSQADANFAMRITGTVRIPTDGSWTFGVNSDDGFRLRIEGASFTAVYGTGTTFSGDTMTYGANRDRSVDSLGVATLSAGDHPFQIDYYHGAGAGGIEFFAASGAKTAFGSSFHLVGDTRTGGLAIADVRDLAVTNVQAAMKGVNASAYVRIPFVLGDPAGVMYLALRMKYDDGFVAYVNGHEAQRANAPDAPAWDSTAAAEHPDSQAIIYEEFDISDIIGCLRTGTNVLAIHGLNRSADDADFLVLPELIVTYEPGYTDRQRYFVTPTPGARNGAGEADLGPLVMGVSEPPSPPADADPIVVTATVRPTLNPIAAGSVTLHYRVMWNAEATVAMADDGEHGDGAPGDGVYGATIPADASSAGQMVRWYVTATDTLGNTGRWPLFQVQSGPQGTGSAEYLGTMVADGTASSMPVFYWFVQNPGAAADTSRVGTDASVYYGGEFYDNVFCRFRGGWATGGTKFDFNREHYFRWAAGLPRVSEINLNLQGGLAPDDAWIRPVLSFETYRDAGVPYSETFMMRVQQVSPSGVTPMWRIFVEQVDEEYLERQGLYGDGALYKMTSDVPQMQYATQFEKKNRDAEGVADLQAFLDGIHQADPVARMRYLFDTVDIPRFLDYQAATVIIEDMDAAQKNYYLYRDTPDADNPKGTGEWMFLPWDKHLTFGKNYGIADYQAADPQAHPFFADSEHPKIDGPGAWNYLIDALLDVPVIKEMYLRRLRTVMDRILQPVGTPYAERYYETRLDELYGLLRGDSLFTGYNGGNPDQGAITTAFANLKNLYLDPRRAHFYADHSQNAYYPDFAGIPPSELGSPAVNFGSFECDPVSGNQDEEYVELRNPNPFAVDISGWSLTGGIDYTFHDGVVLPAGGSLYVSPNVAAFRARAASPKGNEGRFVQGNYDGRLTGWGETVRLLDNRGEEVAVLACQAAPSDVQRYLRVTEVMYNPLKPLQAQPPYYNSDDFEYIELKNISADVTLHLGGVQFTDGVAFAFPAMDLAPGASVLVVGDRAAFESRYGAGCAVAGRFALGNLNNGGEHLRLADARNDTVLSFTYDDKWFYNADAEGFSLTIRDPLQDRGLWDSKDGWRPSRLAGGSPGADDADLAPGAVEINEVLAHQDTEPPGDWIELTNTTSSPIDVDGWFLSDDALDLMKYRITADANHPSTTIPAGGYMTFCETYDFGAAGNPGVATPFALGELGDTVYLTSVVSPGGDLAGYREVQSFGASAPERPFARYVKSTGGVDFAAESAKTPGEDNAGPLVGPVVINEIMYHPSPGGDEFIELLNLTAAPVLLYDPAHPENAWKFTDGVTFAFAAGDAIPAGRYALVVPIAPDDFRAKYGIPADVPIFGPYAGALANEGESLELSMPGAPEPPLDAVPYYRVDRVTYSDEASWPAMADGRGSSLIRSAAADYGNDVANWAAGNKGGTPGGANAALDSTPPSTPTGLTAALAGKTQIVLSWSPAADAETGVGMYYIYVNSSKVAASPGPSYAFTSVWPGLDYSFQVSAANGDNVEGGRSGATPPIHVVTLASATAAGAATVNVTFSEAMNRDSAQVPGNYVVTDGGGNPLAVTAAVLLPGQKCVALTLAAPMSSGATYTVSAANVMTKSGYPLAANSQAQFTYTYSPPPAPPVYVLREYWTGIGGGAVSNLTGDARYPDDPTGTSDVANYFETTTGWGDSYGQRLRTYVTAPTTGAYTFWIASDDNSELWLSTDESPANIRKIAWVSGWTSSRQWTKEANQQSAAVSLAAGARYYVEVLHKEGAGGDNLAVGWQLPDATYERPIPVSRLTAYVPPPAATVSIQATAPTASEAGQAAGTFTISRDGSTAKPLTVYYTVGGTASAGDLQEDLTGIAQIPAGRSWVAINVTPVDDHVSEPDETVRLSLLADKRYALGTSDATVTILDGSLPAITSIEFNGRAWQGPSAIDPSGRGVETIRVTFSEAVTFAEGDVEVQTVAFSGNSETVVATLVPKDLAGSGTSVMTVTLEHGAAIDTWVKVTIRGDGALRSLSGRPLDGHVRLGGSGRSYIYDGSLDLPTGNGTPGASAVFYVGSLRGDFASNDGAERPDGCITCEDVGGFLSAFQAGDPAADFRGDDFASALPDGLVTACDVDGFLSAYDAAAADGKHLDALPDPGPQSAGQPEPLAAGGPEAATPVRVGGAAQETAWADSTAVKSGTMLAAVPVPVGDFAQETSWADIMLVAAGTMPAAPGDPSAAASEAALAADGLPDLTVLVEVMGTGGLVPAGASAAAVPLASGSSRAVCAAAAEPVLAPDGGIDLLAFSPPEVPPGAS
jgi:hypothetical protein